MRKVLVKSFVSLYGKVWNIMEEKEFYEKFEKDLLNDMLRFCTSLGMQDGTLLSSDDIDGKWKEFAPEYMADAVPQINEFPEAALGWAGFIGMAIAQWWDEDWGRHHSVKYKELYGPRGFDDMDDHIVADILACPLGSSEAGTISKIILSCAQMAMDKIRRENIEAQTNKAYQVLARSMRAIFRIGVSIRLKKLGYKFQKVEFRQPLS